MYILGLSRHHDSAAALLRDGEVVALAEEERFNRVKHFGGFPTQAVRYCLDQAGITLGDVDHVAYFWQRWPELLHGVRHVVRYPSTLAALRPGQGGNGRLLHQGVAEHADERWDAEPLRRLRRGRRLPVAYLAHVHAAADATPRPGLCRAIEAAGSPGGPPSGPRGQRFSAVGFDEAAIFSVDGIGSDGTCTLLAVGRGTCNPRTAPRQVPPLAGGLLLGGHRISGLLPHL